MSARLLYGKAIEMRHNFIDVHDVRIFVMQIEQVDLMRQHAAVEAAFLHNDDMEAIGIGIDR